MRGVEEAACGARKKFRRAESAASGRQVASVAFGDPPASGDPFLKRPCTERDDAPRPARRPAEAYPPRYGEGGQRSRSGCSGPRMPGSPGNGSVGAGEPGAPVVSPRVRSRSRAPCKVPQRSISRNAWIRIFVLPSRGPGSSPSSVRTGRPTSSRSRMSSICRKQNDWT
jgi:hypothetical protein